MSYVIFLGLVRTCNLQVITSHSEMIFELKGNANLIRYSDLCIQKICLSLLIEKRFSLHLDLNQGPSDQHRVALPLSYPTLDESEGNLVLKIFLFQFFQEPRCMGVWPCRCGTLGVAANILANISFCKYFFWAKIFFGQFFFQTLAERLTQPF